MESTENILQKSIHLFNTFWAANTYDYNMGWYFELCWGFRHERNAFGKIEVSDMLWTTSYIQALYQELHTQLIHTILLRDWSLNSGLPTCKASALPLEPVHFAPVILEMGSWEPFAWAGFKPWTPKFGLPSSHIGVNHRLAPGLFIIFDADYKYVGLKVNFPKLFLS
jgi:hypothetical protein